MVKRKRKNKIKMRFISKEQQRKLDWNKNTPSPPNFVYSPFWQMLFGRGKSI
jgi:hypothetical protein